MRLSLRFILPLAIVLGLIAYGVVPVVDSLTVKWFVRDIDIRSKLIANTLQEPLTDLIRTNSRARIVGLFNRVTEDERLLALGYCDPAHQLVYETPAFPSQLNCGISESSESPGSTVLNLPQGPLHVSFFPVALEGKPPGDLILVHDLSFIHKRSSTTRKYIVYLFAIIAAVISLTTVIIAQLSMRGLVSGMRALVKGEALFEPVSRAAAPELRPLVKDLRRLVSDLETERRTRDENHISWASQTLRTILNQELAGNEILIVSNREPYIHVRRNEKIEIQVPASGLVTALEPIMRACSGTWIAHGSGSADRDVVDENSHVRVPPEKPSYQIRRVWLNKEEEAGYYYGFSNEGLWPLCHIAHTRPTFRTSDWNQYVAINRKFATAVSEEAKTNDPVILVQDYHFALLPKLIREKHPQATIITFWHIPWPNPEAFGICPWRSELLDGLLGSSILGFHTRFHCNNFMDTIDRYLETRIDRETSTISYGGKLTAVNHYPISIEWPVRWLKNQQPVEICRSRVRRINKMPSDRILGIGVDRLDYTKGILERFLAVERLLEMAPEWIGRFTFIQIAAPSRSNIDRYQHLGEEVTALARKINDRFSREGYDPICLKLEHCEPARVFEYFRGADLCFVSSLHDGMNLVAKEFVASRDDERGVLLLSQFTGASRELTEALIVNPYNIDQCAAALHLAIKMPEKEQRDRMRSMRGFIQEFNIYRWAGRMLIDASRIRQRNRLKDNIQESPDMPFRNFGQ